MSGYKWMQLLWNSIFLVGYYLRFKLLDTRSLSIILVGLLTAGCATKSSDLIQASDRNILLITIDTLRG